MPSTTRVSPAPPAVTPEPSTDAETTVQTPEDIEPESPKKSKSPR
jgi:hypothetical protein